MTNVLEKHIALIINDNIDKKALINALLLNTLDNKQFIMRGSRGQVYSDTELHDMIAKEQRYDQVIVAKHLNRKLRTFSSGERKKMFLVYILEQDSDFIILDNPLDYLDHESRQDLIDYFNQINTSKIFIQLANRSSDILPFIKQKYVVDEANFQLTALDHSHKNAVNTFSVPPTIKQFIKISTLVVYRNVSVSYNGQQILRNINWTIKHGELWQLVGPNGSGKSTLLDMITGENTKGYGQNFFLFGNKKGTGESIWDIKQNIGYFSPVITELFERKNSVKEIILSGFYDSIGLYQKPTDLERRTVDTWLDEMELSELCEQTFLNLSTGLQRVVLILRAVVKQPPLLLLDEPIEGLDDTNVNLIIDLIHKLRRAKQMAIVFVSHRIEPKLKSEYIYKLTPTKQGSIGEIIFN